MRARRGFALAAALLLALVLSVTACRKAPSEENPGESQPIQPIRVGTLPVEDPLPLWVAETEGTPKREGFPAFATAPFASAAQRDAALADGSIQAAMTDIVSAAQLEASGTHVTIATLMLGATSGQGRFGIAVPPGSMVTSLKELAGVPVGTSSATIQEYVLDGLMREAGVPEKQVVKKEVRDVAERFRLLMSGKLKAASLPEPFLTLAQSQGARIVGDDTRGENLSQTVLVITDDFLRGTGGLETEEALLKVWDAGARDVNADPNAWRGLLMQKANLPSELKDTYQVQTYPTHRLPTSEQVNAVLDWMREKGYLKVELTYEDLVIVGTEQ